MASQIRSANVRGVTLVSTVFAIGIFAIIGLAATAAMYAIIKQSHAYGDQIAITALADQYLELARNLPYSQVGTLSGNPHGALPDQPNAKTVIVNGTTYELFFNVTYMDDPADGTILAGTDPAPNDYKQVKLTVQNTATGQNASFVTNIVPKGLENLNSGGALYVQVIDANGQPVAGASVHITNTALSPSIDLTRTTDSTGHWIEVGLPNSANSYHVVVTKSGYSSDQTYPSTGSNPNPVKPDATIANGQVTQVNFAIDKLSSLTYDITNVQCQGMSGVGLEMKSSKLIGSNPTVYKFDQSYTSNSSGQITIPSLEWDDYAPTVSAPSYMIYGSSPIQQINVLPGTTELSRLILGPATANGLLVIVKDQGTGNPIEGATVELSSVSTAYDKTQYTEGSVWSQNDWSGGPGQANFVITNQYNRDDGNIDTTQLPTGIRLKQVLGSYVSSGWLESSTYDTGTASTSYSIIDWQPTSQSPSSTLAFQIATNNDNATWTYLGPDGTTGTYYTVPGTTINATSSSKRYVRYKAYLGSSSTTTTPVASSVSINYISGCAAPGQAMFAGLTAANDYVLTVTAPGYTSVTDSPLSITGVTPYVVSLSSTP